MSDSQFGFLVLGAGRGGTSLIAALLDAHPQLAVAFERFSEDYLMGKALHGDHSESFDVRTDRFMEACNAEAARSPGKTWANKITTEQLAGLEAHNSCGRYERIDVLETFFNRVLAGKKVLFVLRDGRTCVRSKMARTGKTLEQACERWSYSVAVYRFLQTRPGTLCFRYEDLLRAPVPTLEEICAFLGVPFAAEMLEGTQHRRMNPDYRHRGFDVKKLELADVPDGCESMLHDELVECGYILS